MKAILIAVVWLVSLWSCYWLAFGHGLVQGQKGTFAVLYGDTANDLYVLKHNDDASLRPALIGDIAIRLKSLHVMEEPPPPNNWLLDLRASFITMPRMAIRFIYDPTTTPPVAKLDDQLKELQAASDSKPGG